MQLIAFANFKLIYTMKRFLLIGLLLLSGVGLNSQTKIFNDAKVGVSITTLGSNEFFKRSEVDGGGSYKGLNMFSMGLNLIKPLNSWLDFETGLEYSKHNFRNSTPFTGTPVTSSDVSISMIDIPLTLRANFLKYFFINGGFTLDYNADLSSSINSQTGIGYVLGIAAKYDFKSGFSIFVNPYSKMRAIIPFARNRFKETISESGIKIGVTYDLSKLIK